MNDDGLKPDFIAFHGRRPEQTNALRQAMIEAARIELELRAQQELEDFEDLADWEHRYDQDALF